MKIGILTFHWSTNYGAILQALSLQEYLTEAGHDVEIVNYKPKKYDFSWLKVIRHPRTWPKLQRTLTNNKKEKLLETFRKKYLKTSRRYKTVEELNRSLTMYDVLISGSDQVLNPNITRNGADGHICPVYWLAIGPEEVKRVGYAVSFGFETYPDDLIPYVRKWVNAFSAIGVREKSGNKILEQIDFDGYKELTPDPTLLLGKRLFNIVGVKLPEHRDSYTCIYMLRHELSLNGEVRYIDEAHSAITMERWLETIAHANRLVTNSYHGMIMALLAHVPFAVMLESGKESGMNDRFFTLLSWLDLEDRLVKSKDEVEAILQRPIDFYKVDDRLEQYRQCGVAFIKKNIGEI